MEEQSALAYFVVIIILIMFVFILSGCYIKQSKSEKFQTPRLQLLNPQPPIILPLPTQRFDDSIFMPTMPVQRKPF